jgi:hypothetical protein
LSGGINDLSLNAFNDQDAKDSVATMELTKQRDLIIRYLAYMSLEALQLIVKNLVFFLYRANPNVYMRKYNLGSIQREVYLGCKEKFQVRLIIYLLSEQQVAKRLRNAVQNNKKKGGNGNLSKEYKARAFLNLFITNASEEQIPMDHVWQLYRLRWQI